MNKLVSIYIDGVKNIEDTAYVLTDKNLMLDINGAGKTALLDAVAILITGKHPTLGDRLVDIMGLLPEDKQKIVIEGTFESGDIIRREYLRGTDKNTQIITVNEKKMKTKAAESLIKEMFGGFVFNIHDFGIMTEKEKREVLFSQFADKLSKLTCSDIRDACSLEILKESEFYDGVLKFAYNKTSIKELTKKQRESFYAKVIDQFSKQENIYKQFQFITKTIFPKLPDAPIQDFMESITEAVRSYKNDMQQEVESIKKSLEKDKEILNVYLNVAQLKEDKNKNEELLKSLEKNVDNHAAYLIAKKNYESSLGMLVPREIDDIKKLESDLKKVNDNLNGYKELLSTYEKESKIDYVKALAILESDIVWKGKLTKKIEIAREELEAAIQKQKKLVAKRVANKKLIDKLSKEYRVAEEENKAILQQEKDVSDILSDSIVEKKKIEDLIGSFKDGKCPVCLTKISAMAINVDGKKKRMNNLDKLIKDYKKTLSLIEEKKHVSLKTVSDLVDRLAMIEDTDRRDAVDEELLNKDCLNITTSIKNATIEIDAINVSQKMIDDIKEKQKKYLALKNKIDALNLKKQSADEIKSNIEKVNENISFNNTIEKRKKSLIKPAVVAIDDKINDAIEGYGETIKEIDLKLDAALENRGIQKKIINLEHELLQIEAATKYVRKACIRIDDYKFNLISDLLLPVRKKANAVYLPIFGDEIVFNIEQCGVMHNKNYIPLKYMSGGQKTALTGALISAIMDESDIKTKIICIEASEVDDAGLKLLLQTIGIIAMDNIIVATFPRTDVNLMPDNQPKGWNAFAIR